MDSVKVLWAHNFYREKTGEDFYVEEITEILKKDTRFNLVPYFKFSRNLSETFSHTLKSFRTLLDRTHPQVALLHNLIPLVNPEIVNELSRRSIPVGMMVHNYRVFCPRGTCYLKGSFCSRCFDRSYVNAFVYNCLGNSVYSALYAYYGAVQKKLLSKINFFVVPSRYVKDFFEKKLPGAKVYCLDEFVALPKDIRLVPPNERRGVLVVGRLVAEKGIGRVLEAAERQPEIPFTICGGGPCLKEYQRFVRDRKLTNVELVGFVDRAELLKLIATSKILVVPSLWDEIYGRVVTEAMMLKTVVLASNKGALPERITDGKTGFIFSPEKAGGLEELIRRVNCDDALCQNLTATAYDQIKKQNDPCRFTDGLFQLLNSTR